MLASKFYLGVASLAGAIGCVGCQQNGVATTAGPSQPVVLAMAATPEPIPAGAAVVADDSRQNLSEADVIAWTTQGEMDDVIVDRITHGHSVFHLAAGDETRLRDAGVSDEVVRAMKATVWN
jgi:hypothetical protein